MPTFRVWLALGHAQNFLGLSLLFGDLIAGEDGGGSFGDPGSRGNQGVVLGRGDQIVILGCGDQGVVLGRTATTNLVLH